LPVAHLLAEVLLGELDYLLVDRQLLLLGLPLLPLGLLGRPAEPGRQQHRQHPDDDARSHGASPPFVTPGTTPVIVPARGRPVNGRPVFAFRGGPGRGITTVADSVRLSTSVP